MNSLMAMLRVRYILIPQEPQYNGAPNEDNHSRAITTFLTFWQYYRYQSAILLLTPGGIQ